MVSSTKGILLTVAAGVVTFLVIQAIQGKRYNTLSGQNVIPGSEQDKQLTDQCGGWAACLFGWAK